MDVPIALAASAVRICPRSASGVLGLAASTANEPMVSLAGYSP